MSPGRLALPSHSGYVTRCIFPGNKGRDSGRKFFSVHYGVLRVYSDKSSYRATFKVNLRTGDVDFDYSTMTIIWRLAHHDKAEVSRKYELSFTPESRVEFDKWLRIINHCTYWALEENYKPTYTMKQTFKMKEQVGETLDDGRAIIIRKFYTDSSREKNQILRDHEVTSGYQHKHILESLDYLVDVDSVVTIHERYYDDLKSVLGKFDGAKISEEYAFFIIKSIVAALVYLHVRRYSYHGDIRPENIKFADGNVVKLSGFYHADRTTKSGKVSGMALNPHAQYCWPPEAGKKKWWSNKVDVWQVGTLLYECLAGKKAGAFFTFPNEAKRDCPDFRTYLSPLGWGKLSHECRDFLCRAMKYNPAKRASILDLEKHPWLLNKPGQGRTKIINPNSQQ